MLSIIHSTINEPEEYRYILRDGVPSAELIIIDSKWSEERKKKLQGIKTGFSKVTYAPPKQREQKMFCDFVSAHNTGLAYAEEPLVMAMGGTNELCPDFFQMLDESVMNFGLGVAFRPSELEASNGDKPWESYVRFPQRYFIMPTYPLGVSGLRSTLSIQTCGFLIMNREYWYQFNGFDERYDIGGHWYDNDLLTRVYDGGIDVIFDQKLMIYRHPHKSAFASPRTEECRKLYNETKHDYHAPNPYELRALHEEYMKKKKDFLV